MDFLAIKTRKFVPQQDKGKLLDLLDEFLPASPSQGGPQLKEKDVLVITSKIVAIGQGRTVPVKSFQQKLKLIKQEADGYLPKQIHGLTIKDMSLIPYAGIDRTNAKGHYVLWPKTPHREAQKIWQYLKKKHQLQQLGVIIVDSFCLPLRWGHYGLSIGFFGFHPNQSYDGTKDIFGNKIKYANSNYVDALAGISSVLMGEGNEQTPLLIIRGFNKLKFTGKSTLSEFKTKPANDLYAPLLKLFYIPHRVQK